MNIKVKSIDSIRCLAMDAVQKANSGHPGTPMALAPLAYTLWMDHLHFNPKNPKWFNRDRFILSNGHASLLQYSILYLCGYAISLNDIKDFRQWYSTTPGHPELGLTPGIETTTGPLGQGLMNAVGMAMAEAHLCSIFNREEKLIDHYTYVFCSDGDLMEGASHEACSLAGHLALGKLICVFDNNDITIEGKATLSCNDNIAKRFESYHWHVEIVEDGNDTDAISRAFSLAKEVTHQPSIIILKTHIGYGSPNKQDTPEAHGSPLGVEEIKLTKEFYGWPDNESFLVPEEVIENMAQKVVDGQLLEAEWNSKLENYRKKYPQLAQELTNYLTQYLPDGWDQDVPVYLPSDGPMATREISADFINAVADRVPWLLGGSADLEPSTLTMIKTSGYFGKDNYQNRNIAFGIREHGMCGASTGMALHGGLRPYAATFFIFTDYARPAIRLACIMKIPVIYVMTHDSIGLGEDGTTHQPIEQLASFRAMPNMCLIRPADANEASQAWKYALTKKDGPTMLVLSRQKLPIFDRTVYSSETGLLRGAYVLSPEEGALKVILIGTGSEVQLALEVQENLKNQGIEARVVSMPSWDLFRKQPKSYQDKILPPHCKARLAIEAGAPQGWEEWVGENGHVLGISIFGASAPAKELFKHYGFTAENIIRKVMKMIDE